MQSYLAINTQLCLFQVKNILKKPIRSWFIQWPRLSLPQLILFNCESILEYWRIWQIFEEISFHNWVELICPKFMQLIILRGSVWSKGALPCLLLVGHQPVLEPADCCLSFLSSSSDSPICQVLVWNPPGSFHFHSCWKNRKDELASLDIWP